MDFKINDDQQLLVDSVGRWLNSDYRFEDFRRFAADADVARRNWDRLSELGLLGVNIPEADGGLGGGAVETLLIMQLFGRALVVDPYVSTAVMAVALLRGQPAHASGRHFLERIAEGSCRFAIAALEPHARYDWRDVTTVALPGDHGFVLSGKKAVVIHGDTADQLIVSARLGETEPGVALFIVDAKTPGVTVKGFPTIDGQRAAEIVFDDVRLDSAALLATPLEGATALEWAIDRGIAAVCAEAVGAMEKLLELTAEHLRTRKQFGQPIGQFQALQHHVADMAIAVEQSRSVAVLAAARIDSLDRLERRRAISAAKSMVGRCGRLVSHLAVQLHGGMGMTDEIRVGYYFKRLTAIDCTWGNVEHHIELYGELL